MTECLQSVFRGFQVHTIHIILLPDRCNGDRRCFRWGLNWVLYIIYNKSSASRHLCGSGIEYFHRSPESLKRRQKGTWRMPSSGMLRRVAFVRTDVSEERSASVIREIRIGELGTTLAITSSRRTLRRSTKHRFLPEPPGVTSQKTAFFIVTAVKTWNLTKWNLVSNETVRYDHEPCGSCIREWRRWQVPVTIEETRHVKDGAPQEENHKCLIIFSMEKKKYLV
jgi:hypothetical protein